MAILQSKESELRYLKRKNLEQESRTIGNYYRDIIRSYGIDCVYHKLDTSFFDSFKTIVDKNTVIEKYCDKYSKTQLLQGAQQL